MDDIPEARRDPSAISPHANPLRSRWLWIGIATGVTWGFIWGIIYGITEQKS